MTDIYVKYREEVLAAGGAHLWPDVGVEKRKDRMKAVMNAMDNDGGLASWRKQWPSAPGHTLAGWQAELGQGVQFEPSRYRKEQEDTTAGAMKDSPRALQYLQRLWQGKAGKQDARSRRVAWKSYMLQEAEAASREAKLRWCQERGVRVVSLQHDGVVAMVSGQEALAEAAEGMARAATASSGFEVTVVPKQGRIWTS